MNHVAQQALARARHMLISIRPQKSSRRAWSQEDEEQLVKLYPDTPMAALTKVLGRPDHAIYRKAAQLKLRRSDAYMASEHACRLRKEDNPGQEYRFKKGHTPWNHGMTGLPSNGRAASTQFKPGSKPGNWLPIGSVRTSQDGYQQRKVSDTGYPPRDWIGIHILVWEELNGPIPPGHCVCFIDGNKSNLDPTNLELLTRAERMRRNTIHRYPPELKGTIRQLSQLKRAIKEASHEK